MIWKMTGTTKTTSLDGHTIINDINTYVEADSMDEAFDIARSIYGNGITGAQRIIIERNKKHEIMA